MEALRERFGKYHVLEKIAQGGMAEVYKVKTVGIAGFEKVQALKRILPQQAREGRFIRSFIDEARIAVELTHRNIVQVFDFGKADGELFLAMELIEGKDLRTVMGQAVARDLLPTVPIAAYIVGEVAAGLDYAHRKTDGYGGSLGIVHCDVSPSNVMLSIDGYVKILDFGIARATFASALERRRLRGKPRYMSPEQTTGEPPSAASDVFALGIIAWELFTGLPLYRGPNLKAILEAVRRTDAPRIDRLNPQVPPEIVNAIATALDRDPTRRGTAADLAAACARTAMAASSRALAKWLADVEARPSTTEIPWQREVTSISVPAPSGPPVRPSVTALLANVPSPAGDFGEGTPGFPRELVPVELSTTAQRPATFAGDATTTAASPRIERTASVTAQSAWDPGASARWHPEATAAGHAMLADALPEIIAPDAAPTAVEPGPFERPTYASEPPGEQVPLGYEKLSFAPGVSPAALRFDDDFTNHGLALPSAPEDTSYDDLEVDESLLAAPALPDEPIDDDLPAMTVGGLGERRRTVVVTGVLSGPPADALRPLAKALGELAYQRGGVVLALEDDALTCAFGLEIAGEDDVAIAMGWALDASALARDTGHETDAGVQLRVGARAGVATTPSADGVARIPQDAIDEARSLAREATPERPLFVGSAGRLTSGLYALREVPVSRRIGRRSRVIEVLGPRGFDERDRARLERRGKFIGRTQQLAELDVWFQRAIAGDRRLSVLVTGVAGVGKSRLVAELVARRTQAGPPMRIVMTGASPASRLAPFSVVIDLYQAALGMPPVRGRGGRAQVVQRLTHLMTERGVPAERAHEVATDLDRAMELRDGVGIGVPEVADLRPRVSAGLAAFRTAMSEGGRERPQLTVIEDIHLADSASLEVLRHSLAVPAHGPELLVLTARPEGPPPPAVDVVLTVGDLVGAELRALIADRLGDAATPLNIAAVLARGGGNPLFVEELAQAVRDAGSEDVPASARDVVAARIDRLGAKTRTALKLAAVLGGTVRARLLEELLGEETLGGELDELVRAGVLTRPESAAGTTEGELQFARGLVREVVYDSLSARAQREAHARVGRLLASRFFAGREEPPAVIAQHLERGGEPAAAAAFWLRAGRLALTASDADAAIAYFSRTLALERDLGTTPPTPTSKVRRREALRGREEACRLRGDVASYPDDIDELQRICEGEPARLADVAIRRAHRMLRLGDYANASVATVVAEDHATAAGDERLRGEALRVRGEILERQGRFDEALVVVNVARELFHRHGALADEMAAMVGRGRIHLMRAHYEAARDAYRPVLQLIEKTGDPWLERIVKNHVAVIEMCLGNFGVAMEHAQRSLELCRRYGDRGREGDALSVGGIILLEVGLYDQAAELFQEALDILSRTSSRWSRADCLIYSGVCELRRGKPAGLGMLDEALAEARRLGARYLEANALVARAGAQLRRGALAAAIDDAAEGTAVARQATLVGYEIQGLARHALALARLGDRIQEAGALAHRALALLDAHKFLEGSEEEVIAACVEVFRAAGGRDRAMALHERGRTSARRKLDALRDPLWKGAYAALPEIKELLT